MSNFSFPPEFESRMQSSLVAEWSDFQTSHQATAPVSIRLNPKKKIKGDELLPIPWCSNGHYLPRRPVFTLDPLLHAGAYYVQEASSMFLEQAIIQTCDLKSRLKVLDLSAAPGGKSTHILSLISDESLLVSNEVIRNRASILSENIQKWGYPNVLVTNNDPSDFSQLTGFFDVIVVDAPCSGEGLFRKDPDTMKEWSEDNVTRCTARQKRILHDAWPALKENGILIYCTCTYNESENENNLNDFSREHDLEFLELTVDPSWGINTIKKEKVIGYRFFPHKVKGEGFFLSVLRKKSDEKTMFHGRFKNRLAPASPKVIDVLKNWTSNSNHYKFFQHEELIFVLPSEIVQDIEWLLQDLRFIYGGSNVATMKHDKLIPEHALALSLILDFRTFNKVEVDESVAIQYLRKESIILNGQPKGFTLLTYQNTPIGWVNNLQSRANNLYPSEWRIRMAPPARNAP